MVEHDEDAIRAADHVIDIGPGAGVHGGAVVAAGKPAEIAKSAESLTGALSIWAPRHCRPQKRHEPKDKRWLTIQGASGNNLRDVTGRLPLSLMTCITGVSGSASRR